MYCSKCGAKLEDGAVKCSYCSNEIPETENAPKAQKAKKRKKKVIALCAIIVAIMIAAVVVLLYSIRTPEETAEQYIKAMVECDAEVAARLWHNKDIKLGMELENCSRKEWLSMKESNFKNMWDEFCGYHRRYSFAGITFYDDEGMPREEITEIEEYLDVDVKEGKVAYAEIRLRANGEEIYFEIELGLIKIGLQWYVYNWIVGYDVF